MLDNKHIPTQEEVIQYFADNPLKIACKKEYAIKWWNRQQQFQWRSKFPYTEMANRWIANATEEERIVWTAKGESRQERFEFAQRCIRQEYEHPGTYSPDDLNRIRECIRNNN